MPFMRIQALLGLLLLHLLQDRNQPFAVEFGDDLAEPGAPDALVFFKAGRGRKADDRNIGGARVRAYGLRQIEPVHLRHVQIGHDHIETSSRAQR
jgi:hypothetical protein